MTPVLSRIALSLLVGATACASGPGFSHPSFERKMPGRADVARFDAGEWQLLPAQAPLPLRFLMHRRLIGHPEPLSSLSPPPSPNDQDYRYEMRRWLKAREALDPPGTALFGKTPATAAKIDTLWEIDWERGRCAEHAFLVAGETLEARAAAYPKERRWLLEWIRGQDAVFASCDHVRRTLPALPADAPDWLRRDRAYQAAAAAFYGGPDEDAIKAFEVIAADKLSPWRHWADFLIARVWLRQLGLPRTVTEYEAPPPDAAADALRERAKAHLERLLADPERQPVHAVAADLLGNLRGTKAPGDWAEALAVWADQPELGPNRWRWLKDMEWMQRYLDDAAREAPWWLAGWKSKRRDPEHPGWMLRDLQMTQMVIEARRQPPDPSAPKPAAELSEPLCDVDVLLEKAENVPADHPLALAIAYQRARLLLAGGDRERAWAASEQLLRQQGERPWFVSSRNQLARLRSDASPDLASALPEMVRLPVAVFYDDDSDGGFLTETGEIAAPYAKLGQQRLLAEDAVKLFNRELPLDTWLAAVEGAKWDEAARRELLAVTWLRAWLLGRDDVAHKLAPRVYADYPQAAEYWRRAEKSEGAERRFAEAAAMLKLPEISPVLHGGFRRLEHQPDEIGSMSRWRWWWDSEIGEWQEDDIKQGKTECAPVPPQGLPRWVSTEMRDAACAERRKMVAQGNATALLGGIVFDWVDKHPDEADAPYLLHLTVRLTRYGPRVSELSKRAFRLLHKRYPKSEWAQNTKHHY